MTFAGASGFKREDLRVVLWPSLALQARDADLASASPLLRRLTAKNVAGIIDSGFHVSDKLP
jgi:hypothetical protein